MHPVPVHEQLSKKAKDVRSQYEEIQASVSLVSVIVGVMLAAFAMMGLMMTPLGKALGLMETRVGTNIGVTLLVIAVLAGLFVPMFCTTLWMDKWWKRCEREAWRWLRYTDLPLLVADDSQWEQIFAVLDAYPWMKLSGTRRPRSLDEQIELASDYSLALTAILRGRRQLKPAVWWGSTTRLADDLAVWAFNSCVTLGCLMVGGTILVFFFLPLWIPWIGLFIKRQAWQAALLNYFAGGKPHGTGRIKPPPGFAYVKEPRDE